MNPNRTYYFRRADGDRGVVAMCTEKLQRTLWTRASP